MPVSNVGNRLKVNNIGIRISERFGIYKLSVLTDGIFKICRVGGINKGRCQSLLL